jgi:ADP-ribose pyrophosphatase YjhB (NUDIX family)
VGVCSQGDCSQLMVDGMQMVVLAVIEDGGKILLIQESKQRIRGKWNLPGGRVEPGEALVDAAVREVREEAGLEVALTGLLHLDQLAPDGNENPGRLRFVFRAVVEAGTLKSEPDDHSLGAAWFEAHEVAGLQLRALNVAKMIALAKQSPPILPISAIDCSAIQPLLTLPNPAPR